MFYFFLLLKLVLFVQSTQLINITPYPYPTVQGNLKDRFYRVAILGTNDLHGFAFPSKITYKDQTFEKGGMEYLTSYVSILKKQWGDRFLWLDAGDEFQGGYESKLTKGSIMTDIFNKAGLDGATLGNHQFDYGQDYARNFLNNSKFPYIDANIYNTTTDTNTIFTNQKPYAVYKLGKVNIGVIGLTTITTFKTSKGDLSSLEFKDYKDIVMKYADLLRKEEHADAVILLAHIGLICDNEKDIKNYLDLNMWTIKNANNICQGSEEMYQLLNELPKGTVDAVIAGHTHTINHYFVNGVPVIASINNAAYTNVLYLSFDKKTKKLIPEASMIEGPIPVCEKVFSNTGRCDNTVNNDEDMGELDNFVFHGVKVEKNEEVSKLLQPLHEEINSLSTTEAFTVPAESKKNLKEENFIGNLAADFLKEKTKSDFAILNSGTFRTTWHPGKVSLKKFYDMFPFDNTIVSFEMTGAEVKKMMETVQPGVRGLYPVSGLQFAFDRAEKKVTEVKLADGSYLDENKMYKIATTNFIMPGFGDDFAAIKAWYTPRNVVKYVDFASNLLDYLKEVKNIPLKVHFDADHPRIKFIN